MASHGSPSQSPPLPSRPTRAASHSGSVAMRPPAPLSSSGVSDTPSADTARSPPSPSSLSLAPPLARRPSTAGSSSGSPPPTVPLPPLVSSFPPSPSHATSSSAFVAAAAAHKHGPSSALDRIVLPERRASAPVSRAPSVSPPSTHDQHNRSASTSTHFSFKGYFNKLLHPSHSQPLSPPQSSLGPLSPRSSSIPFHVLLQHHRQYSSFLAAVEDELLAYGASMTRAHDSMRRLGATLHGMYRMKAVEDASKRRPVNRSAATTPFSPTSVAASAGSSLSWLSASFASQTTQAAHIFDTTIQQRLDLLILPWLQQKRGDSARIDQLIADDAHNWQRYEHYSQKVADMETAKERDRRDGKDHADRERYERNRVKLESSQLTYQHCHHGLLRELASSYEFRFSFLDSLLLELVKAEQSYHTGLHAQLLPIIVKVKEMIKGERKAAAFEAKEEKGDNSNDDGDENTVMLGTQQPTLSNIGFSTLSLSLPTVSSASLHARYQFVTKIGAGTYGETVLCTDSADESVWVIKRLQCSNVRQTNRAIREAMMMNAVKACHYVCRVREVFIEDLNPHDGPPTNDETMDGAGREGDRELRYDGETGGGGEGVEGAVRPLSPAAQGLLCTVCIVMEYCIGGDLQRRIAIECSRKRQLQHDPAPAPSPIASPPPDTVTFHDAPIPASASPRAERSVSQSFNSSNSNRSPATDDEGLTGLSPSAASSLSSSAAGFPTARVVSWMYQLCSGIHSLHTALLLHRDIKPENLFLTATDDLRIGDYGIMHELPSASARTNTHIGTPAYMAPECIGREGYGLSADVWSAGCVLFELCTLSSPSFSFRSIENVLVQVRQRGYSEQLVGVLRRMLSVEAKERPTAAECAEAFKRMMMAAPLHQKECR